MMCYLQQKLIIIDILSVIVYFIQHYSYLKQVIRQRVYEEFTPFLY